MNKKILFVIGIAFVTSIILPQQNATAHVLISDKTKSIGAVLHLTPDDDPIAGEQANLYFDIQTTDIKKADTKLSITNINTDEVVEVDTVVAKKSVMADYTFPVQGVYNIELVITSDRTYTFSHSQRVSRDVSGSALDIPTYPLATVGLVFGGISLLLLAIVSFNNKSDINKHSTF